MQRRTFLLALLGAPTVAALVAACGKEKSNDPGSSRGYTLPTGSNDVVLRVAYEGGFVPVEVMFVRLPNLLVTGDGRVITPAPITMEYPGPLVAPMNVRTITPAGLQALAKAADDARLIGFVSDYELPDGIGIADASDTVVTITANGETYEHRAYALGLDEPNTTPTRERLAKFVDATGDMAKLVGAANLGEDSPFTVGSYRFRATVTDPTQYTDPMPIIDWPADTGVTLASATTCATVDASKVGSLFTDAKQNNLFREDGVVYQVAVAIELPGDAGCTAA